MTDVLVTYEDGSTDLRPASCPALAGDSPTTWHPADFTMADVVPARPEPVVAFLRPGERRGTHALRAWRWSAAMVWCITGGYGKGEPLTGEWRLCRVETMAEQIERLTLERDAALAQAAALAATVDPTKAVGWAAKVVRLTEDRDAEKARADAAEKRLAGLRAWAEDQNNWDGFHVPDVIAEILDRTEGAPCSR